MLAKSQSGINGSIVIEPRKKNFGITIQDFGDPTSDLTEQKAQ